MSSLLLDLKRSLTTRLLAVFMVTSLLLIILLLVVIAHGFAQRWAMNARPHMEQYLNFISTEIGNPPSIEKAYELADRLPIDIYIIGPDTNYSTNGQKLDYDKAKFDKPRHRNRAFKKRLNALDNIEFSGDEDRTLLRNRVGEYQVYYELSHRRNTQQHRSVVLPTLLAVLSILTICFLVIRRMLRPVRDIELGVRQMGTGDLSHRVPVRQDNDLGQLAISINTMAADIEKMLDAKRQLLLGASHELRSPLTRAKVAVQLIEESKSRQLLEDDLHEMDSLISNILESERMKTGHAALQLQATSLPALVQSVIDEMQTANVIVECEEAFPTIQIDEKRIRILLRNLIGNAIIHRNEKSPLVKIELAVQKSTVKIYIRDSGAGIAPEHLELVTEPFYRTDASRNRSTGGFGLGLHLAQLITIAHGGNLKIESQTASTVDVNQPTGTTVIVELPTEL